MNYRSVRYLLGFMISCCCFTALAQREALPGVIQEKDSHTPIPSASVKNVMSGSIVLTKRNGDFIADVAPGNILAFSSNGYFTDTLTITEAIIKSGKLFIELRPIPSSLENVTVYGRYNTYQYDSLERRKQFLENVGENKIPTVGRANDLGFGVALNLDHFSKREKNKRAARSLFEILEEDAYINYRWNDSLVAKYTSFKDDQLTDFIQQYRPDYDWLRKNPDEEDMKYYINSKLKKMKKIND